MFRLAPEFMQKVTVSPHTLVLKPCSAQWTNKCLCSVYFYEYDFYFSRFNILYVWYARNKAPKGLQTVLYRKVHGFTWWNQSIDCIQVVAAGCPHQSCSAGVGCCIHIGLMSNQCLSENPHILSNTFTRIFQGFKLAPEEYGKKKTLNAACLKWGLTSTTCRWPYWEANIKDVYWTSSRAWMSAPAATSAYHTITTKNVTRFNSSHILVSKTRKAIVTSKYADSTDVLTFTTDSRPKWEAIITGVRWRSSRASISAPWPMSAYQTAYRVSGTERQISIVRLSNTQRQ